MSSKRMVRREKKRVRCVQNNAKARSVLTAELKDPNIDLERKFQIIAALEKKRNASAVRLTRRCRITGSAHGVYRKVGLRRNEFIRQAQMGNIPGMVMSSW